MIFLTLVLLLGGRQHSPSQPLADMTKGAHLYGSCQSAVRLADDPDGAQAKAELAASTYCFGYFSGYVDGVNRLTDAVCLRGASLNTVARVYSDYMRRNPKLAGEDRSLGALLALLDGFPCGGSAAPSRKP